MITKSIKLLAYTLLMVSIAGCACISLTPTEVSEIEAMRASGVVWSSERDKGRFEPPVSMSAAVWWGVLPGAGQHFIAHKIADAGLEDRFIFDKKELQRSGTIMLAFSWIPYVYDATCPFGIGGIIQDVNRVNNYALLQQHKKSSQKSKETTISIEK